MRFIRIDLRLTLDEKEAWAEAAKADKMTLADWIRNKINTSTPELELKSKTYKSRYFDVP